MVHLCHQILSRHNASPMFESTASSATKQNSVGFEGVGRETSQPKIKKHFHYNRDCSASFFLRLSTDNRQENIGVIHICPQIAQISK
jgi:hypothetical protein